MRSIESPPNGPRDRGATVIHRTVAGAEELVVVCERCPTIEIIGVPDAMRIALQMFLKEHDEERHERDPEER